MLISLHFGAWLLELSTKVCCLELCKLFSTFARTLKTELFSTAYSEHST